MVFFSQGGGGSMTIVSSSTRVYKTCVAPLTSVAESGPCDGCTHRVRQTHTHHCYEGGGAMHVPHVLSSVSTQVYRPANATAHWPMQYTTTKHRPSIIGWLIYQSTLSNDMILYSEMFSIYFLHTMSGTSDNFA